MTLAFSEIQLTFFLMRKRLLIQFFCLALFFSSGQFGVAESVPFLWEIQGEKPSWLFGTIHLPDPELLSFHPAVQSAFDRAEIFNAEIPMDTRAVVKTIEAMWLPDDQSLAKLLDPPLIERIVAELKRINPGLELKPLDRCKPWALAVHLVMLEPQMSYPGVSILDDCLYRKAEESGKQLGGIETIEEQLSIFDALTMEEQIRILIDTLDQIEKGRAEDRPLSKRLMDAYRSGDIDTLWTFLQETAPSDPNDREKTMKLLLHDRNKRMAECIARKLRETPGKSHFFAVGAGHLCGDTAIQKLLAADGFVVDRRGLSADAPDAEASVTSGK
jgi:hypothetical protein